LSQHFAAHFQPVGLIIQNQDFSLVFHSCLNSTANGLL
jgi:hypothetical protein